MARVCHNQLFVLQRIIGTIINRQHADHLNNGGASDGVGAVDSSQSLLSIGDSGSIVRPCAHRAG
jgi:hypothetical protein